MHIKVKPIQKTLNAVRIFVSSIFRDMHTDLYTHMAHYISTIREKMKQTQDMMTLTGILEEANEIIYLKNWDWRVALILRKMEAP